MAQYAKFREFIHDCNKLAEMSRTEDERKALLRMASAWRELALEEERMEQLIQEVDQAFGEEPDARGYRARLSRGAGFAKSH